MVSKITCWNFQISSMSRTTQDGLSDFHDLYLIQLIDIFGNIN